MSFGFDLIFEFWLLDLSAWDKAVKLFVYNNTKYRIIKSDLHRLLRKVQRFVKLDRFDELSVAIISQKEIKEINRVYRGMDEPTDVLSFDYGEILLCPECISAKYQLNKKSVQLKMQEMFAHGLCHIAGFNHYNKIDASRMKEIEQKILL